MLLVNIGTILLRRDFWCFLNIASNCFISILTPMGTPLLGYRVGDVIGWEMPRGFRRLKVKEILYQPEANNEDLA